MSMDTGNRFDIMKKDMSKGSSQSEHFITPFLTYPCLTLKVIKPYR